MAELNRTDSSFTNNPKANRAEQVRRDDDTIKRKHVQYTIMTLQY